MEDGGLFRRGVWDGLVICRDWRRCDLEHDHYAQGSPLIGAIRLRGDRRGWRANWARASKARTRHAMCRCRPFLWRFHRVARDERIESAQVQERIRLSGNKVVTSSPSGGRRTETVDQKKQKRSRSQSRQLFEPSGPHHTSAIERANPCWRKPASKLVCVRRGHFRIKGAVRHRLDNIPDRGAALQEDTKTSVRRSGRVAVSGRWPPPSWRTNWRALDNHLQ